MDTKAKPQPLVLTSEAIIELATVPIGNLKDVERKILWREESSEAGVLVILAGHRLGAHRHRTNHHLLWVLAGRATVLGTEVGPGSFVYVPSGIEHDVDATATDGCAVFYLYAP